MKTIELDVRGGGYKRYYAKVTTPDRRYYSISIECADYKQQNKNLVHAGKTFRLEICQVQNPELWVFHDLVYQGNVESQNVLPSLSNLLAELRVINKGVPVKFCYQQFGKRYCEIVLNPGYLKRRPSAVVQADYEYSFAS